MGACDLSREDTSRKISKGGSNTESPRRETRAGLWPQIESSLDLTDLCGEDSVAVVSRLCKGLCCKYLRLCRPHDLGNNYPRLLL